MRGASPLAHFVAHVAVAAVAVACLVAFAAPVVKDMSDGRASFFAGTADASAAMVYVLTVPVLTSLSRTATGRLVCVGLAAALGLTAGVWVDLVQAAQWIPAFLISGALVFGLLGGAAAKTRYDARQRQAVRTLARVCAHRADGVRLALLKRWGAAPGIPDAEHPRDHVALIDSLVAGAIATAAAAPTPRDFAVDLLAGLGEIADGAARGAPDDPRGYRPRIAREYAARLRAEVGRRTGRVPRVERAGRALTV